VSAAASLWRRRLAIALLALFVLAAAPFAVTTALRELGAAMEARGESVLAARRRVLGGRYADGIERLRAELPADRDYLLFDAGTELEGARNWVRYDLAPRQPVFGGYVADLGRPERVRQKLRGKPADCVVAFPGDRAPLRMSHDEFVDWLARGSDVFR
jgi:hypothetical protein